jgi:hypothetical protein
LLSRHRYRTIRIECLQLQVPPHWGDLERDPDGGFVIHNRPARSRIDGDAVWYSTAMELRIRRPGEDSVPRLAPMTVISRTIECEDGPWTVTLAVANGVGPARRREGYRVLSSARSMQFRKANGSGAPGITESPTRDTRSGLETDFENEGGSMDLDEVTLAALAKVAGLSLTDEERASLVRSFSVLLTDADKVNTFMGARRDVGPAVRFKHLQSPEMGDE